MTNDPLPGMPEPPPCRPPQPRAGETVSRYATTRVRRLCDVCTFLIHRDGQARAPYPRAARWRRSSATETHYLCSDHKETRL